MDSSRIFVRGLPSNLPDEEFQRHFSKLGAITDTKLISHRRIGYIGYKTNEDATKAVKYYNKTFIRMSRIAVELARSVDDQNNLKARTDGTNDDTMQAATAEDEMENTKLGKRKRDSADQDNGNTKLKEYLHVMQPPSKLKTWSNEDLIKPQGATYSALDTPQKNITRGLNDGDSASVLKTPKEVVRQDQVRTPLYSSEGGSITGVVLDIKSDAIPEKQPLPQDQQLQVTSDGDWLRSRFSNKVDLVGTDGATTSVIPLEIDEGSTQDPIAPPKRAIPDLGIQADVEPKSQLLSIDGSENATGRLFVRNLAYASTEDDLREYFASHGPDLIKEVHLPKDHRSGNSKGFAYIQYSDPEAAKKVVQNLDGKSFQGRLLHIIPAEAKKHIGLDEVEISKLPLKKQQQIKRKSEAASSVFNWNSLYMNADAVISSISDRLGVSKSTVLDPTSSDAAIKQALAETHIIQETKTYFAANGVNLEAFKGKERSETAILIKNFVYGTTAQELKALFDPYGDIIRVLMPPSGIISIVEFSQPEQARSAFSNLAYRKFKDSILFLEKAPKMLFNVEDVQINETGTHQAKSEGTKPSIVELLDDEKTQATMNTSTLFVRNLNFSTTTSRLREVFQKLDGFASARVKMKPDPKKPGQFLSMGFGFLEFQSKQQAQAALCSMNGYKLDGHELLIRASHKAVDAAEERRREDQARKKGGTKIIVKNLPFEATKKDVRTLFGSYGQLRSVRVPKKFDSSTRGFAFADFTTAREAYNAMTALKDTHLLGRRLVLDFAAEDAVDPEKEIEKMQEKVGNQANKIAVQQLASVDRRKFIIEGSNEVERD